MVSKELGIDSGESAEIEITTDGYPLARIVADPAQKRGVGSPNPPVSSYEIEVETKERGGAYEPVYGSPVSSSSIEESKWGVNDVKHQTRITVTNTGSSKGFIYIIFEPLRGDSATEVLSSYTMIGRKSESLSIGGRDTKERDNHVLIDSASALPDPVTKDITLADGTVATREVVEQPDSTEWELNGTINLDDIDAETIERGANSIIYGKHWGADLIYSTGPGPVDYASGAEFHSRFFSYMVPGGTVWDLSASESVEFLSDKLAVVSAADLGHIDGYRVPVLDKISMDSFNSGLVFSGSPDKIFVDSCVLREISASGVTMFTFDGGLTTDVIHMVGGFIRDVQSDTEVVRGEAGSLPSVIFNYQGMTHDDSVVKDNILNGDMGVDSVGTIVAMSPPLPRSRPSIAISSNTQTTITGSGSSLTEINAPTTVNGVSKMSSPSDGVIQYDGRTTETLEVNANITVTGAATTFHVHILKNGNVLERAHGHSTLNNSADSSSVTIGTVDDATTGDQYSVGLENTGGTTDLDVESINIHV